MTPDELREKIERGKIVFVEGNTFKLVDENPLDDAYASAKASMADAQKIINECEDAGLIKRR